MNFTEIRELDARAVRASVQVVSRASAQDMGLPTPCGDWTLSELLAHMTAQHDGFAAAAAGNGADLSAWLPREPASVAAYEAASGRVIAAFAADGVAGRKFVLPQITRAPEFPPAEAIGFHLVDYVAHGWDVARSLGLRYELEPDLLDAALEIAKAVPDDARRLRPGAAFAPRAAFPAGASTLDQVVALLGRSPGWTPPSA
jgi:uncharacterized protein (TIGR03086 family)